jgi:hypothetical protein
MNFSYANQLKLWFKKKNLILKNRRSIFFLNLQNLGLTQDSGIDQCIILCALSKSVFIVSKINKFSLISQ